jgi:hypothetical protein
MSDPSQLNPYLRAQIEQFIVKPYKPTEPGLTELAYHAIAYTGSNLSWLVYAKEYAEKSYEAAVRKHKRMLPMDGPNADITLEIGDKEGEIVEMLARLIGKYLQKRWILETTVMGSKGQGRKERQEDEGEKGDAKTAEGAETRLGG